ncbi:MAG: hypothetical protein FWD76_00965 [Firmicutes bacterium]|nr:hypothetical protein [Bacillota bacterium]
MNIALDKIAFSRYGAYLSLAQDEVDGNLLLKSLRGKSKSHPNILSFAVFENGKALSYKVRADFFVVTLVLDDKREIGIAYDGQERLLVKGDNMQGITLVLDTMPVYNFEYNYLLGKPDNCYAVVNSYKNLCKNLVYAARDGGAIALHQKLSVDTSGSAKKAASVAEIHATPNDLGEICVVIEDIATHMAVPQTRVFDFVEAVQKTKDDFAKFCGKQEFAKGYKQSAVLAQYILWSGFVRAEGNLKRDALYASNRDFLGVWSWDHCFNALGVAVMDTKLAYDQLALLYDHQDKMGQIPGSVSDSTIRWNFTKPPIQALFYGLLWDKLGLSKAQKKQVYAQIKTQIEFYLTYKDCDGDGLCEYHHGNDSGQDNSTVFEAYELVDAPDLNAYLLLAIRFLQDLAGKLKRKKEVARWQQCGDDLTKKFLEHFLQDGLPYAYKTLTKTKIESEALLPYVCLLLGDILPQEARTKMVQKLRDDFLTGYGIATECTKSPLYADDAYWRGPIWAPTTFLMVTALKKCGESKLAKEVVERFCKMVDKEGFAENFDALRGVGLRDKSFSWTAAVFLHFVANEALV